MPSIKFAMGGRSLRHPMTPLRQRIGALLSSASMIGHHGHHGPASLGEWEWDCDELES